MEGNNDKVKLRVKGENRVMTGSLHQTEDVSGMTGVMEEHPTYKEGYWLTNTEMEYVVCALLGEKNMATAEGKGVYYPTSYDLLAKGLVEFVERYHKSSDRDRRWIARSRRWNHWVAQIINCGHSSSSGIHWIMAMVEYKLEPTILLWDPLSSGSLTKRVIPYLQKNSQLHASPLSL